MTAIPQNVGVTDPEFVRLLNKRFEEIASAIGSTPSAAVPATSHHSGSHAQRLSVAAASVPVGTMFYETDRTLFYMAVTSGGTRIWRYVSGTSRAAIANKPTGLGAGDAGLLFHATDYRRTWRWTGAVWTRADSEDPRQVIWTDEDPGTGWALANGSASNRTTDTATVEAFTLPDLIGSYVKGASAYTGSVNPAVAPTITGVVGAAAGNVNVEGTAPTTSASSTGHTHLWSQTGGTAGEPQNMEMLPYYRL